MGNVVTLDAHFCVYFISLRLFVNFLSALMRNVFVSRMDMRAKGGGWLEAIHIHSLDDHDSRIAGELEKAENDDNDHSYDDDHDCNGKMEKERKSKYIKEKQFFWLKGLSC